MMAAVVPACAGHGVSLALRCSQRQHRNAAPRLGVTARAPRHGAPSTSTLDLAAIGDCRCAALVGDRAHIIRAGVPRCDQDPVFTARRPPATACAASLCATSRTPRMRLLVRPLQDVGTAFPA